MLLALLVLAVVVPPARAQSDAYVIGPGDILEIQVWENKALDQTVFVRPDGKISLPLVGEVQAGGRTIRQFQDALTAAYATMVKAASVTVIVKEIRSRPVYFVGGFARPGVERVSSRSCRRSPSWAGCFRRRTVRRPSCYVGAGASPSI
jgi:polysaccharide export outer membrane protein